MIVVSNTSPIINLAVIGQLNLLRELYDKVIIPQAVYDEIVIEGAGQAGAEEIDELDWIEVKKVTNRPMITSLEADLDVGEAEAIVLAVELNADLLLIDERKGRILANHLGINYIGLLGILVRAKHEGLISTVGSVMDSLMTKAGFWISDDLYNHILRVAGESK
jgi:predicted nucleic acid-binding protein